MRHLRTLAVWRHSGCRRLAEWLSLPLEEAKVEVVARLLASLSPLVFLDQTPSRLQGQLAFSLTDCRRSYSHFPHSRTVELESHVHAKSVASRPANEEARPSHVDGPSFPTQRSRNVSLAALQIEPFS